MNKITVYKRSKAKEFCKRFKSKTEDILFAIIEKLPDKLPPSFVMEWASRYIDKRMAELKREQVKVNWDKTYLEIAVKELRSK